MSERRFDLHVVVSSPVGIFSGIINGKRGTSPEIVEQRDSLQKFINKMDYLVLFGYDGITEHTIPGTILKNSIVSFAIKERPDNYALPEDNEDGC